ncbi:TPA: hypothetical protein I7693_02045 [Vibrio vulnificus]|nr:hypothetical protein [Vibrio vulnificus]HAS8206385.1 hypothetical protein [Vibrio vulnificus]HAS8327434.1 hypothetical protein [Vibrio vulnificus]
MVVNKIILASAVAAAAASGAYFYKVGLNTQAGDDFLAYVPADTPLISLQTNAINHYEYLTSMGYQNESFADAFDLKELTPEQAFLLTYFDGYLNSASNEQSLKNYLGTGDNVKPLLYTLGMVPVYKFEIENPTAFWATIDKKEKETGATHEVGKLGQADYRRYVLATEPSAEQNLGFVIALEGKVVTFTLDVPMFGAENTLKMALGAEKPQHSFADSGKLAALQTKYGQNYQFYAYLDNQEVIKGITLKGSNQLARQIDVLQQISPEDQIDVLRQPTCHTELTAIANNWPRIVSVASYQSKDKQLVMDGSIVVESNNQVLINALKTVRGFIPSDEINRDSIFGISFGLDVAKLAPAISNIWNDLTQPSYSCELLAEVQREVRGENPAAAVSMGAGMVNGVKGIQFSLNDITMNLQGQYGPEFEKLDFLFSLSADDPSLLVQTAKMFVPQLAEVNIEPNGQAVDLSALVEAQTGMKTPLFARMNDKHLTLYAGEKAAAGSEVVLKQPLEAGGLWQAYMNTSRILEFATMASELSGEPIPEEVSEALTVEATLNFVFDANDKGLEMRYDYRIDKSSMNVANQ